MGRGRHCPSRRVGEIESPVVFSLPIAIGLMSTSSVLPSRFFDDFYAEYDSLAFGERGGRFLIYNFRLWRSKRMAHPICKVIGEAVRARGGKGKVKCWSVSFVADDRMMHKV
jgi:hypothetical protein